MQKRIALLIQCCTDDCGLSFNIVRKELRLIVIKICICLLITFSADCE